VVLRLAYGGMENGLVTIANRLRAGGMRHSIVCLEDATDIRARLAPDVPVHCLGGRYRSQLGKMRALRRVLRELRPDIVHTRNLPTIDLYPAILAAGVRRMVHSEHGVETLEAEGSPLKYRLIRRLGGRVISRYVALSDDLRAWMAGPNGIPAHKITTIVNGVDTARFRPAAPASRSALRRHAGIPEGETSVIASLGRLTPIKDHANLARAYTALIRARPDLRARTMLLIGGDGPQRPTVAGIMADAGLSDRLILLGDVDDPAAFYGAADVFVLPSKSEGTSNTVLEAMASALPVVATDVGENSRLVADGETGAIVPPGTPTALATEIASYVDDPARRRRHGARARERARTAFSLDAMLSAYAAVYAAATG
jgi:sugar transferase (PEP-CTERM/EpsH1 system associated)